MTRRQIIEQVLMSDGFRLVAENITQKSRHLDDIIQDIAVEIMTMEESRFMSIRNPKAFCIGIVWRQFNSSSSPFHKKYRQKGMVVELNMTGGRDIAIEPYDMTDDIRLEAIMEELKTFGWYDEKLLLSYFREGSFMKLHQKSGIHYQSVRKTVNKVVRKLKGKFNPDLDG